MQVNNLYKTVLIDPADGANTLFIVSGYASATFTRRHLVELMRNNKKVLVNLIIGMPGEKNDDVAFKSLHNEFRGRFKGYYLFETPPVHSKVYSWYKDDRPIVGFAGSANYSQFGFFSESQINQISDEHPVEIRAFYDELLRRSVYIPDHKKEIPLGHRPPLLTGSVPPGDIEWEIPDQRVRISFLDRRGQVPGASGLNWGQGKGRLTRRHGEEIYIPREPNEAYLSLKGDSRKEGFLPEKAYNFSLITDDGKSFDCVVAQDGRKGIESTNDNRELGRYLRQRFGLPQGAFIKPEDLEAYGRTDFTIEKIDDETVLLDLSVTH